MVSLYLRNALRRHVRLIVKYSSEVFSIRKNLGLVRQIGTTRVDQIDTRQAMTNKKD